MTPAAPVLTTALIKTLTIILFLTTASETKRAYGKSDSVPACTHCDKSKCPVIGPVPVQYCPPHSIVQDACGCCERCTALIVIPTQAAKVHTCTNVTCPSRKICMVNIQGLPVCRCPTEQMCRDFSPRQGKVCASEGSSLVTFPSECHMRVAMCHSTSRKMKLLYRGACPDVVRYEETPASAAAKLPRNHEFPGWLEQPAVAASVAPTARAATAAAVTTTTAVPTTTSTASATTTKMKLKTTKAAATIRPTIAAQAQTTSAATQDAILLRADADAGRQNGGGRGRGRLQKPQEQGKEREGERRDRAAAAAAVILQADGDGHSVRHSGRAAKRRGARLSVS